MNAKKGFTLIELLVVIAIVSLLSSIVLSQVRTARTRAKLVAIQQSLTSLRNQAEIFRAGNGGKYNNTAGENYNIDCFKTNTGVPFLDDPTIKKIISEIPKLSGGADPSSNGDYMVCDFAPDYYRVMVDMWSIGGINTSVCMSNYGNAYANVNFSDGYPGTDANQVDCTTINP